MFVSDCLSVSETGHLTIGGRDTIELAASFGTPLYVMDEEQIRSACRRYKASIDENYGGRGLVTYASKAFSCKEMCRIIADEGMGLDVVSGGELHTALSAGFPAGRIFFHGNNKTPEELAFALRENVGRIVVDNIYELELLSQMAKGTGKTAAISFRIKPGVDAHTHDFVKTGSIDSKFGLALETGEAFDAVKMALSLDNIRLIGVHCHIGSQIFDIDPFELSAEVMLGFMARVKDELGYEIGELNLGGGFGIKYIPEHDPVEYERYMKTVSATVRKVCAEKGLKMPFIVIEPGRSIAGPAGVTLYKVGGIKEIPGVRTYVSVDGGMADNPRYILYEAEYDMLIANKAARPKTQAVTVAGRCCESGDLIGENVMLQDVSVGDTLAVLATGAYNYSMSSNYNRLPKPAVVMVSGGEAKIVVKRETYEDVVRNDL
ncbi:MAG: diaminopimelate decarboxylase [Oscillospiraceae bacterium]|jgi:diaminopimelate decarboxylase|nr:diaminopimelate decarboxylase [Oscillospiraceae bacterium]